MTPKQFKEANVTFAKDQPEYKPLPAFKSDDGIVVSCWKLSFIERLTVLFKGVVWQSSMTFNKPLTPTFLAVKKSEVLTS